METAKDGKQPEKPLPAQRLPLAKNKLGGAKDVKTLQQKTIELKRAKTDGAKRPEGNPQGIVKKAVGAKVVTETKGVSKPIVNKARAEVAKPKKQEDAVVQLTKEVKKTVTGNQDIKDGISKLKTTKAATGKLLEGKPSALKKISLDKALIVKAPAAKEKVQSKPTLKEGPRPKAKEQVKLKELEKAKATEKQVERGTGKEREKKTSLLEPSWAGKKNHSGSDGSEKTKSEKKARQEKQAKEKNERVMREVTQAVAPHKHKDDEPLQYPRKTRLSISWIERALPFTDVLEEEARDHTRLREGNRLRGVALERESGRHWRDLWDRDTRVFLQCLLKKLGIPYSAALERRIPAARLATTLRSMGIEPRSRLMNFICDHLIWGDDETVSFQGIADLAGPLDPLDLPESEITKLVGEIRPVSSASLPTEGSDDLAESRPIFELEPRKYSFTAASTRVISGLFERLERNDINTQDFALSVQEVTGASHRDRLDALLLEHDLKSTARGAGRGRHDELTLQKVLCAALKDMQDETVNAHPTLQRQPRQAHLCHSSRQGMKESLASTPAIPSDDTVSRLRQILTYKAQFPRVPTEADMRFLRELARAFASGWLPSEHFKSLVDVWDLALTPMLARAIRDHCSRGRCSLRQLWLGLILSLENKGIAISDGRFA